MRRAAIDARSLLLRTMRNVDTWSGVWRKSNGDGLAFCPLPAGVRIESENTFGRDGHGEVRAREPGVANVQSLRLGHTWS